MSHVYVSMFGPMPAQPTGLAMSVLRRAQAFASEGITTDILIDKFYPDYEKHESSLSASGSLGTSIKLRSLFHEIADQELTSQTPKYTSPLGTDGWSYTQDEKRPEVSRGRFHGDYRQFVWTRDEGQSIHFIDELEEVGKKRKSRDWYDSAGLLCKRETMSPNNKTEKIEYIRRDGSTYLIEIPESETGQTQNWELIDRESKSNKFSSFEALYHHWLSNYVLSPEETPTVISEYGFHRTTLQTLERTHQATVVYTFHSNHLGGQHTYGSPTRTDQSNFIENLSEYSSVVLLTNEQRLDLWKHSGYNKNLHVIPHHLPNAGKTGQRDPKKVVMIGRFDKDKGHEDALHAFKRTLEKVPEATMDFYGRGADEERIKSIIAKLNLTNSVKIMGFTNDSFQVFAESAISLVPSSFEGFCLSLAESMASGCVPIAYDFKYGPRSLINNGVDGLIVEKGNTQDLADAMALVLCENNYRESLSAEARKISRRLTEAELIKSWKIVLREAKQKKKPTRLADLVKTVDSNNFHTLLNRIVSAVDAHDRVSFNDLESMIRNIDE